MTPAANRRALAAALAAVLAFAVASPAAARDADFAGLYSDDAFWSGADYRAVAFAAQAAAGSGIVRQPFEWRAIETAPGVWDWGHGDAFVGAAAVAGLKVLPVIGAPPAFASQAPEGERRVWYPPDDPDEFGAFAARLAERYGRAGSFWDENPHIPRVPVTAWQVWNEPNLPAFWGGDPDAAGYVDVLKAAAAALRAVDPAVEVVSAGLPQSEQGTALGAYVDGMYAAGARGWFDTFAVHGYAPGRAGTVDLVRFARALLDAHGDPAPIWLTEFGWATAGSPGAFTVTESEQAERLRFTLATLWAERGPLVLRGLVYFKWRDSVADSDAGAWPHHAGLHGADGIAKPAFAAFRDGVAAMTEDDASGAPVPGPDPAEDELEPAPDGVAEDSPREGSLRVRSVTLTPRRFARVHLACAGGPCAGRLGVGPLHAPGRVRWRPYRIAGPADVVLRVPLSRAAVRMIRSRGRRLVVRAQSAGERFRVVRIAR